MLEFIGTKFLTCNGSSRHDSLLSSAFLFIENTASESFPRIYNKNFSFNKCLMIICEMITIFHINFVLSAASITPFHCEIFIFRELIEFYIWLFHLTMVFTTDNCTIWHCVYKFSSSITQNKKAYKVN
nr:unnamed protein product [Callosobruchus chinensis]